MTIFFYVQEFRSLGVEEWPSEQAQSTTEPSEQQLRCY